MRLLYSGATHCDVTTLKRLLVIADEIIFMDRPSVTFHNWGTVGVKSPFRQLPVKGKGVQLSVVSPPSGPATEIYRQYIEADLRNSSFRSIFLEGLAHDDIFASKFIDFEASYRSGTGNQVRSSILGDPNLPSVSLENYLQVQHPFEIEGTNGRRETLKILLIEASIHVTNAMIVSQETGCLPVTDDPYFARLLGIRMSHPSYIGGTARVAPFLGLEVAKAVIPDNALQQLTIANILKYRMTAKQAYDAWSVEVNRLATRLDQLDPKQVEDEFPRLIASEVAPRIIEYRNDMKAVRDRLFGDMVKEVVKWEMPSLSIAHFAGLSPTNAIALFISALVPAVPHIVDYIQAKRNIGRNHAIAYLIGLTKAGNEDM